MTNGLERVNDWQNEQLNMNYQKGVQNSCIRLNETQAKKTMELEAYEKKLWIKALEEEHREETKLSKTEEALLDAQGCWTIQTKNLTIQTKPRKGANFAFEKSRIYRDIEAPGKGVLVITILIGTNAKKQNIWLKLEKLSDGKYLTKKLATAGAKIIACNVAKEKEYAVKIVQYVMEHNTETCFRPMEPGWYKTRDGKLKFLEKGGMKELLGYAE